MGYNYLADKSKSDNLKRQKALKIYRAGQANAMKRMKKQEKNASLNKEASKPIDFFKRLGDLYKGTSAKKLKAVKEMAGKKMTQASNSGAKQSVVDRLNRRYGKASWDHAKEQAKRALAYGTTGVAGVTTYKAINPKKKNA